MKFISQRLTALFLMSVLPAIALAEIISPIGKYKVDTVEVTELPMPPDPEVMESWAGDINNNGDIVGSMPREAGELKHASSQ